MANVDSVPAGKYGKAALNRSASGTRVEASVAQAENVRAALALVVDSARRRSASSTQTDANAEPKVKVVGTFPEDSIRRSSIRWRVTAAIDKRCRRGLPRLPAVGRRPRPLFEAAGLHGLVADAIES